VPLGIAVTIHLIPEGLMDEFRAEAARREVARNQHRWCVVHDRSLVHRDRPGRLVATPAWFPALAICFAMEIVVMS
jgi:hypothetical protein